MSQENIYYVDYPTERCLFSNEISSLNEDVISAGEMVFDHNFEALSANDIPFTDWWDGRRYLSSLFTPKLGQFLMGRKSQDLNCSIFDGLIERFLLTRCDSTYDLSGLCSADFDSLGGEIGYGWGHLEKAYRRDKACGMARRNMMHCYDQSINTIIDKCYLENTDISCSYGIIYTTNPDSEGGPSVGDAPWSEDATQWMWTYGNWQKFLFQGGDYHNGANRAFYDVTNIDPKWLSCIHREGDIQKMKDRRRRRVLYDLFDDLSCDDSVRELDESRKYEKPYVDWMNRYCADCTPISSYPMVNQYGQSYDRVYAKYGSMLGPKYSGYGPGLAMNLLQMAGELALGRPDFEYVPTKCKHIEYFRRISFNGFSDDPEVTHTHFLDTRESTTEVPTYQYDLKAIPGKIQFDDEWGLLGLPGPIIGLSVRCDYDSIRNELGASIERRKRVNKITENIDATVHIDVDIPLPWNAQTNRTIKRPTKADWPNIHSEDVVESMNSLVTLGWGIMDFFGHGDQFNAQYHDVDYLNYLSSENSYVDDSMNALIQSWYEQIVPRLIQVETLDPKTSQVAKYFPSLDGISDYDNVFGGSFSAQEAQIKQEIIDAEVITILKYEWLVGDVDDKGNGIWILVDKDGNRKELWKDPDGVTETLWNEQKLYIYDWHYYGKRDDKTEKIPLSVRDFAKLRYCFRDAAFWEWKRLRHNYYQ